jgi:curli biogenesis system outer membrane secretion channel CsgG
MRTKQRMTGWTIARGLLHAAAIFLLCSASFGEPAERPVTAERAVAAKPAAPATPSLKESQLLKLLEVRAVYVDPLKGNGSEEIRDMLIGSLHRAGLFLVVEDEERADAFLRGAAEDLIYSDYSTRREGLNVRGSASSSERESGESEYSAASFGIGDTESSSSRQRKHEALVAVRLVLGNGEVIWSATQESAGAKYKGAGSDVADKVAKELVAAFRFAEKVRRKVNARPVFTPP